MFPSGEERFRQTAAQAPPSGLAVGPRSPEPTRRSFPPQNGNDCGEFHKDEKVNPRKDPAPANLTSVLPGQQGSRPPSKSGTGSRRRVASLQVEVFKSTHFPSRSRFLKSPAKDTGVFPMALRGWDERPRARLLQGQAHRRTDIPTQTLLLHKTMGTVLQPPNRALCSCQFSLHGLLTPSIYLR